MRPALGRMVGSQASPRWLRHPATAVVLLLVILLAVGQALSTYWIDVLTAVAIYSVVALGLGLLMGRVGLVSLGQIAVLALGAWVAARLDFATSIPFPLVLLIAGTITMVLGTLVGLPALRLSGLYLALITLMLAGAITVVLTTTNFPNGGPGFLGHTESSFGNPAVRRPGIATTDLAYFRYTAIVAALMFALVFWHLRSRPGRAWAAIRQSEPAALAAGVNITTYKLWAWALASFVTGVAGGLLAGSVGKLYTYQFPTRDSIILLAVVLMGGIYNLWGAVVAGALMKLLPALLDNWGLPPDLLVILFGAGVLQVLLTAPGGLAAQVPKDLARLGRTLVVMSRRRAPESDAR
jgi:branched-chain amino acid transport system permease protein